MNKSEKCSLIKNKLLYYRLVLVFIILLALGFFIASKGDAGIDKEFFTKVSSVSLGSFLVTVFKCSHIELFLFVVIGFAAFTFLCGFITHVAVAAYGFVCGAYASALLSDEHYSLLLVCIISFLVVACILARWAVGVIVINGGFINSKRRIGERGLFFSPLILRFLLLFIKSFCALYAVRAVYCFVLLFLI